jgi:hypothetical protein
MNGVPNPEWEGKVSLLILRSLKRMVGYAGVDKLSQAYLTSWYSQVPSSWGVVDKDSSITE